MDYILRGIVFGLGLSILLGPIFIVLIQSTLENGRRAGLLAATGIWVSDILFVALSINFVKRISPYVYSADFRFWVGLLGALVLIGVGIATFFKKAQISFADSKVSRSGMIGYWIKGFMVNTVNPFTVIFWLSLVTAEVLDNHLNATKTWLLTGAIIATIVVTDTLKVMLAKVIQNRINEKTLTLINRIAGIALILFGFGLLLKTVV